MGKMNSLKFHRACLKRCILVVLVCLLFVAKFQTGAATGADGVAIKEVGHSVGGDVDHSEDIQDSKTMCRASTDDVKAKEFDGEALDGERTSDDACIERTDEILSEINGKEDVDLMERVLYELPKPDERLPSSEERKKLSQEEYEKILKIVWYSRQKEIKSSLEAMDNESGRIVNYTKILLQAELDKSSGDLVGALENLEWMVQDIDLALYFVKVRGLDLCSRLILQHEIASIRALSAYVAGSAIKNNPQMQAAGLEAGLLRAGLLRLESLEFCSNLKDEDECSKILYLIGSGTRGFIPAQEQATASGILRILTNIVKNSDVNRRALVKAFALVTDVFSEWKVDEKLQEEPFKSDLCNALNSHAQTVNVLLQDMQTDISPSTVQLGRKLAEATFALGCDPTVVKLWASKVEHDE